MIVILFEFLYVCGNGARSSFLPDMARGPTGGGATAAIDPLLRQCRICHQREHISSLAFFAPSISLAVAYCLSFPSIRLGLSLLPQLYRDSSFNLESPSRFTCRRRETPGSLGFIVCVISPSAVIILCFV